MGLFDTFTDFVAKKVEEHVKEELPPQFRDQLPGDFNQQIKREAVKEVIKTAEDVNNFMDSTIPGAKPKTKSPYKHVPGMTPHESILLSAAMFDLKDNSVLQALCQKTDGSWDLAEIDLNDHYSNRLGKFESDGSGFKHTGRDFKLDAKDTSVLLKGELALPESRGFVGAEVELSICIVVKGGKFVYERHDGFWDRDGWLAIHTEGLPLVGFITASIQNITDNEDHARRALAKCSDSSIVTIAAILGGLTPGGAAAAALAAGLATPLGMIAESHWADTIKDPRLRDQFEEATIGRAMCKALTNMIGTGVGSVTGKYVGQWLGKYGTTLVTKAATQGATKAVSSGASAAAKAGSKAGQSAIEAGSEAAAIVLVAKIAEVMKGSDGPLKEWEAVERLAKEKYGV